MLKTPLLAFQNQQKVLAATRLHFPKGTETLPDAAQQNLKKYAASMQQLHIPMAIAVNMFAEEIREILIKAAPGREIEVLHIPQWGAFVPALNALLGHASKLALKYILFHSLEVTCSPEVLEKMMNHFMTAGVLVVGPVLDGHSFEEGEQKLNGRTTPWNTLALWSVRKLAMTGFLNIADGLPARQMTRQITADEKILIGSADWWIGGADEEAEIPAGVEEVTAIALLQHILGRKQARAVLLDLPPDIGKEVSWKTNWGQDLHRKNWHERKMASKVARPAAQIKQLFKMAPSCPCWPRFMRKPRFSDSSGEEDIAGDDSKALHFGTVMHFSESIRPPVLVEWMCLFAIALFSANFTSVFAPAFRSINVQPSHQSLNAVTFLCLLIGGVLLPMPVSLWLTRWITSKADHKAGLLLFSSWMLVGNALIVCWQLSSRTKAGTAQQVFLLACRLIQGMGSGVLFQTRFVLASLSTEDHHDGLHTKQRMATDIGLGFGALLPAITSMLSGQSEISVEEPELLPSAVITFISLSYMIWVILSFPSCLHPLPKSIRFKNESLRSQTPKEKRRVWRQTDETEARKRLLLSGTTRVFVQSAIVLAVAVIMRDIELTGHFRQTYVVAILALLPVPFEAWSRKCSVFFSRCSAIVAGAVAVILLVACFTASEMKTKFAALQLVVLILINIAIAPLTAGKGQLSVPEKTMVVLEWTKCYLGRLCGPIFALVVYNLFGSAPLVILLCLATIALARFAVH
mmetsp:Transcript_78361/g.123414  ORF Transcript_78361/g.123414 Transcript_78361/m.123414 type:complete len:746 (+) Transcript_78361:58-2295(+)